MQPETKQPEPMAWEKRFQQDQLAWRKCGMWTTSLGHARIIAWLPSNSVTK